jgi:hypothetical protein
MTHQLLAVKIFSILVNSMPDECTNSTITWFNSPIHGNQKTQTIIDMIKVGQWFGKHNAVRVIYYGQMRCWLSCKHWKTTPYNERYRPVVKIWKVDEAIL